MVSIIVPSYDCINSLKTCITSVLQQSHSNFEVILVDDGSSDGSGELCDRLAAEDERIQVIHKPNGGVSSARNAGIDVATGNISRFATAMIILNQIILHLFFKQQRAILTAGIFGVASKR